jgi:HEAT repeat protein
MICVELNERTEIEARSRSHGTSWAAALRGMLLALVVALSSTPARARDYRHHRYSPSEVSALIAALRSPDLQDRRNAARTLATIKPLPPEAIAPLAQALNDSDPMRSVQNFATVALSHGGAAAIPALKALMDSKDPRNRQLRIAAVHGLGGMAAAQPATWPLLVGALSDPDLQAWASMEVARIGAPVVPMLRPAVMSKNPVARRGAVAALQMAPGAAREATPELIGTLKDSDPGVRALAAIDLGRIGPPARSAIPALSAALNDPRYYVRDQAALAIGKIDPTDQAAIPTLIGALKNNRSVAHWDAPEVLSAMGPNASSAVAVLEDLLANDSDVRYRAAIAKAIGPIAGAGAAAPLARAATEDKDPQVRLAALDAIAAMGTGAEAAIPALVRSLGDQDRRIRDGAANTLAALGERARPALLAALRSPDLYTRQWAIHALAKSKPLPQNVADALATVATGDKSAVVRYDAANVLNRAGVAGGHAALEKTEQEMTAAMTEAPAVDTKRLYRRQEIFGDIPPDDNHEYPLRLVYLLSFNGQNAEMLAAVYRGADRRDRLIFWRQSGDGRFQQIQAIDAGPDPSDRFDPPKSIFIPKGQVPGAGVLFVDVGISLWRGHGDYVFAVDGSELRPVEIESPETWYRGQLKPGEEIVSPSGNSFCSHEARFSFLLRVGGHTKQVVGNYKVVKQIGGAYGMVFPSRTPGIVKGTPLASAPTWKLVPDSARVEPLGSD